MLNKFYLTTPIYYVNDVPHIGHAYTTVAADVLARYKRMLGQEVWFLTGTDEHGQKIWQAAEAAKEDTQAFVDQKADGFKEAWKALHISYDDFIRTTEPRHVKAVQEIFSQLLKQDDVYKGEYQGWYCVPCESYWAEMELKEDPEGRKLCPDCGRATEILKEESYFFKLSKYQDQLLKHLDAYPEFIQPESRRNEIVQFIKQGLKDLSVTRTAFPWGIPLKEDPKHVIYVWFDALSNYISALGYPDGEHFKMFWPADVHLMGKEIVRFHAVTWPCMLLALGLPLPEKVFGHGWWTVEGKKMSKSKGNVVDPIALAKEYGVDAVRYFLMREVPFGVDGDFSLKGFTTRFNADLANDIGNLLNRSLTMVEKYFGGVVPEVKRTAFDDISKELVEEINSLPQFVGEYMDKLAFSDALSAIWRLINLANTYIEKEAPWKVAKENDQEKLGAVMYNLIDTLRVVAVLVSPFMPTTSQKMWDQLGFGFAPAIGPARISGTKVKKGEPMFPRLEKKPA